ncbi:hypothetical protein BGW39_000219 [Mortierella sp. 14UC]|nr:hypothetical protein BGW39_000219 [Mortierella sp. 14UC]
MALPGLHIKAAADLGIAEASTLLDEHLVNPDTADADADADEDEVEEALAGETGKKTGFSAKDVKRFQAASALAAADGVPLLTMQDGVDCGDVCIANQDELPDSMTDQDMDTDADTVTDADPAAPGAKTNAGGDAEKDSEEEDADDETEGEGEAGANVDKDKDDSVVSRFWRKAKRAVAPAPKAPMSAGSKMATPATPTETNEDDDDESDDTDSAPNTNGNPTPAPGTGEKKVLSESELQAKVTSCVKTCMLNRAKEITPEDLDDRRMKIEALLHKQGL